MERKIFWIIAFGFALLAGAWFFLWRGNVEFIVPARDAFTLEFENGKEVSCPSSPCRVRFRAGRVFAGRVIAEGFLPKKFTTEKISVFRTPDISLELFRSPQTEKFSLAAFDQVRSELETPFKIQKTNIFGPALFDPKGAFAVFSEKKGEEISIFVVDNLARKKLLTSAEGVFELLDMHRNFRLQDDGVVIPEKNKIYFFDFALRRKVKIWEGDVRSLEKISVSSQNGKFVGRTEKGWQMWDGKAFTPLAREVLTAAFLDGTLWMLKGTQVFANEEMIFEIQKNIRNFYEFWFEKNTLFLKGDDEVWRVGF